jgi:hypothetical protein
MDMNYLEDQLLDMWIAWSHQEFSEQMGHIQ